MKLISTIVQVSLAVIRANVKMELMATCVFAIQGLLGKTVASI